MNSPAADQPAGDQLAADQPAPPRIILLVTSPRVPAGLLTAEAWDLVRAHPVQAAAESELAAALRAAGVKVSVVEPDAGELLVQAAGSGTVIWLAAPGGAERLARELGRRLVRQPALARLELVYGSWDPPGARLLDVVAVVDQLAAPGGDPWLRQFMDPGEPVAARHQRLSHYLLEEAYEGYDALNSGQPEAVREELGDILFQVVLHASLAASDTAGTSFDIDDLAGDLAGKLVRRNPHVFGDAQVADLDEITHNWERIKRQEKERTSAMDGLALSQPALALAAKVLARAERAAGAPVPAIVEGLSGRAADLDFGARLFEVVVAARAAGIDPEGALRSVVLELIEALRAAEAEAAESESAESESGPAGSAESASGPAESESGPAGSVAAPREPRSGQPGA